MPNFGQSNPTIFTRKNQGTDTSQVLTHLPEMGISTWWLIPVSKWVITPVISGLTLLIPFITGVITHLLTGMSHQVLLHLALSQHMAPRNPDVNPIEMPEIGVYTIFRHTQRSPCWLDRIITIHIISLLYGSG